MNLKLRYSGPQRPGDAENFFRFQKKCGFQKKWKKWDVRSQIKGPLEWARAETGGADRWVL